MLLAFLKFGLLWVNSYYSVDPMKYAIPIQLAFLAALSICTVVNAGEEFTVGEVAPEFELPDQTGQLHSLEDYRDQWVVLYFYPKDETPGCTKEACEFRDNIFAFKQINAQILGVSFDDTESHLAFSEHHELPFPLLADTEGKAAEAYNVKTKMLGMTVAKRQTFLIDPAGRLAKHYVKVNPTTHAVDVLADLKALGATARID